jgi:hypothetical protein
MNSSDTPFAFTMITANDFFMAMIYTNYSASQKAEPIIWYKS